MLLILHAKLDMTVFVALLYTVHALKLYTLTYYHILQMKRQGFQATWVQCEGYYS